MPPLPAFAALDSEAYRYAVATGSASSEVLLVGSSLVRYGVREDLLAEDLGDHAAPHPPDPQTPGPAGHDLLVFNAALDGGKLWEALRLVDAMPPSRASKRRLAVLEVNRVSSETALLPHPYQDARLRAQGLPVRPVGLRSAAEAFWEQVPPRQDAETWAQQALYGAIGPHVPHLVPVPHALPRVLWMLTPAQQARAARDKQPVDMGRGMRHSLRQTPEVLKLLVAALHQHGFKVLLLQTPLHGAMLDAMAEHPLAAESERAYRAAVLDPRASGADDVLAFDRTPEIGGDDGMLLDYGHLVPAGAALLTHRLAAHLLHSPIWADGAGR
jgi:hypothetical protein